MNRIVQVSPAAGDTFLKDLSKAVSNSTIIYIHRSRSHTYDPLLLFLLLVGTTLISIIIVVLGVYLFREMYTSLGLKFFFRIESGAVKIGVEQPAETNMDKKMLESMRQYIVKRVREMRGFPNGEMPVLTSRLVFGPETEEEIEMLGNLIQAADHE